MVKEIINQVSSSIDEVFEQMAKEDFTSFILLVGRADIVPGLSSYAKTDCVIDYQLDRYYDETREGFYLRYLNRNYSKEGFKYDGESGVDDLSIELMIYMHLWDSMYFLKSLARIAAIVDCKGYLWKPNIPENGKYNFVQNNIVKPLKDNNLAIGGFIEQAYSSDIRNAFAHSLYTIDKDSKKIYFRPKTRQIIFSFDEFQDKFLKSVVLMNILHNALELNHNKFASQNTVLTPPFFTPDNVKVQIKGVMQKRGDTDYPEFRLVRVD